MCKYPVLSLEIISALTSWLVSGEGTFNLKAVARIKEPATEHHADRRHCLPHSPAERTAAEKIQTTIR